MHIKNSLLWRVLVQVVAVLVVLTVASTAVLYWGVRAWNERVYSAANIKVLRELVPAWQLRHGKILSTIVRLYSMYLPGRIGEGVPLYQAEREVRERLAGLIDLGYTGIERLFVLDRRGALDYAITYSPLLHTTVTRRAVRDSVGRAWIQLAARSPTVWGRVLDYFVAGGDTKYLVHFDARTYRRRIGYRQFAAAFSLHETMKHVTELAGLRSLQGVVIVAKDGTVLYEKDPRWVGQSISRFLRDWHFPATENSPTQIRLHTRDGRALIVNWNSFSAAHDEIMVGVYTDLSAFEPSLLHRVVAAEISLSLFALVVVVSLLTWRLRKALSTVASLSAEADEIARGRWGGQVPVRGQDEVARLAENFNRMSRQLSVLVERVAKERGDKIQQRQVSEFRAHLLRTIGHDLNKILGAIKGPAENLAAGVYGSIPDRARRAVWRLLVGVRLMESMVLDMLAMARIERGELKLNATRFRAKDLIRDVNEYIEALVERVRREGIAITVDNQAENAPLFADREKLVRVLVNLVSNAVESVRRKKPAEGGWVELRAFRDAYSMVFEVRDNGEGISEEEVERFNAEGKIHRSFASNGLGLGLTIVRAFVDLHQGKVELRSEQGKGSVFRVRIPLADQKT